MHSFSLDMKKLSIIGGTILSAVVGGNIATCNDVDRDGFIDYWKTNICEDEDKDKDKDPKVRKNGACVYTYGRETIVDMLSDETRRKLVGLEVEFLVTGQVSNSVRKRRDSVVGRNKAIYWHTTQKCPSESCYILCYSEQENGCRIILTQNGIRMQ